MINLFFTVVSANYLRVRKNVEVAWLYDFMTKVDWIS